jgi:hypothetical protein
MSYKKRLYTPGTFTRCQERIADKELVFGDLYGMGGVYVTDFEGPSLAVGVCAVLDIDQDKSTP